MMHSTNALYDSLRDTLAMLNSQIAAVVEDAEKEIKMVALEVAEIVTVYQMKHTNGQFILTDLLVAKAQTLSAMAALKASTAKR